MAKLREVAKYVRSKNAGPFWVTLEIFCEGKTEYDRIAHSRGMKMDISNWINLASAIGTIGATTVALWLALRDTGRHVDGTFIWEAASSYQPILLIQNTSRKIFVLESIEINITGRSLT